MTLGMNGEIVLKRVKAPKSRDYALPGVLVDHQILQAVEDGSIGVLPWIPEAVQPASLDLHLAAALEIDTPDGRREHDLERDGPLVVYQLQFLRASTMERIELPANIGGDLSGKSTLARLGLQVEAAGYVDPGFRGNLTLELFMMSLKMIRLEYGMAICQITFFRTSTPSVRPYGSEGLGSHYQDSVGTVRGADKVALYRPEQPRQGDPEYIEGMDTDAIA